MEPVSTIAKNQKLPPGQDYALLRQEGLAHLQQLSGRVWTDYNDHDPGVTLLEALCFTLTDMGSRAALPVPTLLAPPPGPASHIPDLLVPAREAFANQPVTLADYRKLLLDRLHDTVKNAWLSLVTGPDDESAAPWHYQVRVELHPPRPGHGAALPAPDHSPVRTRVLALLNAHRNLGEHFGQVIILKPYKVVVGGHLDLLRGQQPAQVLAAVLRAFDAWIAPAPPAITLAEMQTRDFPAEELFAGPAAEHCLFDEASFAPQRLHFDCAELGVIARQVPGIREVSGLRFHGHTLPASPTQLAVPAGRVAVLDAEASLRHFTFSQHEAPLEFNSSLALWTYRQQALVGGSRLPPLAQLAPLPAKGHYAELGRYESVQRLLPALYGTSEEGPRAHTSALGRAHVMQLKGYLLLFDQLLANFCAQLENAGRFFSPAPQATTTYTSALYNVPYVAPLLPGTGISPDEAWQNNAATAARWLAYQQEPHNPYQRALQELAEPAAGVLHQRSKFLAHLLARFGYAVQQYHARETEAPVQSPEAVEATERLLTHLHTAAYHRGAARVASAATAGYAESGLEFFLFLLVGLESLPRKWARRARLADLEASVHLEHGAQRHSSPRLEVRGRKLEFAELLDLFAEQLRQPTLVPLTATTARLHPDPEHPHYHTQLELAGAPGDAPATLENLLPRLLAYGRQLDAQLERFTLLDHLVLLPHSDTEPAAEASQRPEDREFCHYQVTLLLPGYAFRFRPADSERSAPLASPRSFVENLVEQHAPAHLLVNILWFDYPAMREWETIFVALAAASGLLNASGQPDHEALPAAQHRARHFLNKHLPHAS